MRYQTTFMALFQIIFNPTSAAELAAMPKRLQLEILGEFRGIPQDMVGSNLDDFGKLEKDGKTLYRFRIGDYRIYFSRHRLGIVVHRILTRNTLKDFFYRSNLKLAEDKALEESTQFWDQIEAANAVAPNPSRGSLAAA